MLYKFKIKKLLNLLEINNLNLNDLTTLSNISTISSAKRSKDNIIAIAEALSTKRSKVIRRLSIKRAVAVRVYIVSIRYIFFANSESYRFQHIDT